MRFREKMIKKIRNSKFVIRNSQKGMTYVELIVVLSIFAVMSGVVMFNYKEFQARVEIKKYASDIALQVVQAQKSAMAGKQSAISFTGKPSYGVYFDITTTDDKNKKIIYFADFTGDKAFDNSTCGSGSITECLDTLNITKGNHIEKIEDSSGITYNAMSVTFTRPNSQATFRSIGNVTTNYVDIEVASSPSVNVPSAHIKIYASGRVQIN